MMNLIDAFHNFANAPKNRVFLIMGILWEYGLNVLDDGHAEVVR